MPELQIKRGTYAAITGVNPVLADGEMVLETDTLKIRVGDGTNTYTNLPILFSGTYQLSGDYTTVGHTHISSDIINFNSGVSGLLPTIANSGDNRVLTSTGSSFGINAENNLTFDGSILSISGNFISETGNLNQLRFNTSLNDPNLTAGQLQWNATEGTLDLGLNDVYAMHLGEEMLYRIRNITGSTLLAGQPVYASGLSPGANNRIEVNLYVADGSIREIQFMGLMTEDLTDNGNNGYATHFGYIRHVDTRGDAATYGTTNKLWSTGEPAWNQGDILYVHPTVPGKLTKIEPKHSISVAIVTRVNSNGKLFVRPTSYGHLDDNHDVAVSGATNGQFLQYNSVTDYWVPSSSGNFSTLQVNGTGVSVSGHTHTSSQITDFNSSVSGLLPVKNIIAGTGITISSADGSFTINSSASGSGPASPEDIMDIIGSGLIGGTGININYNDSAGTISINLYSSAITGYEELTEAKDTFTVSPGYLVGNLQVYYNGLKLINGQDYTATDGSSFVLAQSGVQGDVVEWAGLGGPATSSPTTSSDSIHIFLLGGM